MISNMIILLITFNILSLFLLIVLIFKKSNKGKMNWITAINIFFIGWCKQTFNSTKHESGCFIFIFYTEGILLKFLFQYRMFVTAVLFKFPFQWCMFVTLFSCGQSVEGSGGVANSGRRSRAKPLCAGLVQF